MLHGFSFPEVYLEDVKSEYAMNIRFKTHHSVFFFVSREQPKVTGQNFHGNCTKQRLTESLEWTRILESSS